MSFDYKGLHLMIDARVKDSKSLTDPTVCISMIEKIVEKIDMTMILPPVTVKFPHANSEMKKLLDNLVSEGLGDSKSALSISNQLQERENESYGYSTFAMIAESHLSIHTFPELNYFSFDCYSCKFFDSGVVEEVLKEFFDIDAINVQKADRLIPGRK
jgi:S-adenosylmethionine decarboxylase